jgi:hypothetical protein
MLEAVAVTVIWQFDQNCRGLYTCLSIRVPLEFVHLKRLFCCEGTGCLTLAMNCIWHQVRRLTETVPLLCLRKLRALRKVWRDSIR